MGYTALRMNQSDSGFPAQVEKYKELRLSALKKTPTAFSSTFEAESKLSDNDWVSRLSNPAKETFICLADADGECVAQVTIFGPNSAEAYALPDEAGQPPILPDGEEEKWQILSLYALPTHRGKGVAKLICREAIRYLTNLRSEPSKLRVRTMIAPGNNAACGLFKSLGFFYAGLCTKKEGLIANGEEVPPGDLSAEFTTRAGIIMALAETRT
ncbi:putative GNAT family acetyltransferase [Dactylonectria macrodidyma]|uniref:GNAT family acetyltransferase n=1 Tax=Dactylonectria macrodidyma TaxID=307937 RepID=A0A9P9IQM9_9HYPO|nr:putative GNAT family acetyltransferase [Dactylonectria macrodidyma]